MRGVLVMLALCVSLVKDLREDPLVVRAQYASKAVEQAVVYGVSEHGDDFVFKVSRDPDAPVDDPAGDELADELVDDEEAS